jgi:UDP-glucose 4-epimerase
MTWLITGSSGYIGQHVVEEFLSNGLEVIGLDSKKFPIDSPLKNRFKVYMGDICDQLFVSEIFKQESIAGIVNLAALKSVEESLSKPELYEKVNHEGVEVLLSEAMRAQVKYFIQSSTAAVYGSSTGGYVDESSPTVPISPYGRTKLRAEAALIAKVRDGGIKGTSLRYFNVIGSSRPELKDSSKANIIPMVLAALNSGQGPKIFGDDYETPDGTCIRDYVHVIDVARAHVLAAQKIQESDLPTAINVGTGQGYSVREIMHEILIQKGSNLAPVIEARRQGDPSMLVAKVKLAQDVLGFQAEKVLSEMISSAI